MAAPIRPVRPGDPISAARFNQVVEALNALGQISGVYPIEVGHDFAGVRIGLAREFKAWLFAIEEVTIPVPRTPDNVPYYFATRLRLDGDDSYDPQWPQDVLLYDPLAKDAPAKQLATGMWVLATFDADIGRWQIVRDPSLGVSIVRFKLTGALGLGSSAAAVVRKWDPTAAGGAGAYVDGDAITVKDYFGALGDPGEWQAPAGYYGFAVKLADRDEYQILYMEHPAEFVAFTLDSDMSGGSAGAIFDSFWMGRAGGGATTVYDRQRLYGSAKTGDKGIACWDSKLAQYVIIDMGRGSAVELRLFYLNADLARGGSAAATLREWNAGLGIWQTTGADVTVYDSSSLGPAATSTLGVAFLSNQSGRYEIIALPGSGGAQVVRFRLYDDLPLGGSATAKIQTWDTGTSAYVDGSTITVVDFYGALGRRGKWQGPSGYYGFAVKLADKSEYQILDMERIALFAQVTITEDMGHTTPKQASAAFTGTNNAWWQGQDVASAGIIYDPLNIYANAQNGDRFIVCWDDFAGQYKIVDGPNADAIRWAKAYADHTLAGASKSNSHYVECQRVDDKDGGGYDAGSPHFNVYLPSPSSATDPNVQSGTVIGYTVDGAGNAVCVTDYLDDARGMIKIWSGSAASIPHGWALCNGASYGSFTTPDLRGKFVLGAQPGGGGGPYDDSGHDNDIGATGGTKKHDHDPHEDYETGYAALEVLVYETSAPSFSLTINPLTIKGYTEEGKSTDPAQLNVILDVPTITTTIDPFTVTVDVPTSPLTIGGGPGGQWCVSHNSTSDGGCGSLWGVAVTIDPDPPTASSSFDNDFTGSIKPNPHVHDIPALRLNVDPVEVDYTYSFIGGSYDGLIYPPEHNHTIPEMDHSQEYHIPPYYALCYIMRVN